ncbi:MAG: oxidoreductase, partial [Silicimonas sp.]|nr:oxidoreductase [Silicimonas sp.]
GGHMTRLTWWLMSKTPLVQTAEKGAYPEVMCATEDGLEQRALYGPTGWMQTGGPVGKGTLNAHAHDKAVMSQLWEVSEEATDFGWKI